MPQGETLRVKDLSLFLKACSLAEKDTKKQVRETFRKVGDIVRVDAQRRLGRIDGRSAAGLRTRVRQRGVAVEQSLKKTTGLHSEYGALQMRRALLPALVENERQVEIEMEQAMDEVADHFERGR